MTENPDEPKFFMIPDSMAEFTELSHMTEVIDIKEAGESTNSIRAWLDYRHKQVYFTVSTDLFKAVIPFNMPAPAARALGQWLVAAAWLLEHHGEKK